MKLAPDFSKEKIDKWQVIGGDESGKSDYIGPIAICATYLNAKYINWLKQKDYFDAIKDSKNIRHFNLANEKLTAMLKAIMAYIPYEVYWVSLQNIAELHDQTKHNLNQLMSVAYWQCLQALNEKLATNDEKVDFILIDAYCSFTNYRKYMTEFKINDHDLEKIIFKQKAETLSTAVALSSMIARYFFLRETVYLANKIGIAPANVPYGCSTKVQQFVWEMMQQLENPEKIFKNNMLKSLTKKQQQKNYGLFKK